ncbi:hypothetical protein C8R45DRAFT_933423 [Mycena sanguinolenta]|nr:hypothetical protein C8R45DRAFT_933423 [Mycena sanguinolenta]
MKCDRRNVCVRTKKTRVMRSEHEKRGKGLDALFVPGVVAIVMRDPSLLRLWRTAMLDIVLPHVNLLQIDGLRSNRSINMYFGRCYTQVTPRFVLSRKLQYRAIENYCSKLGLNGGNTRYYRIGTWLCSAKGWGAHLLPQAKPRKPVTANSNSAKRRKPFWQATRLSLIDPQVRIFELVDIFAISMRDTISGDDEQKEF